MSHVSKVHLSPTFWETLRSISDHALTFRSISDQSLRDSQVHLRPIFWGTLKSISDQVLRDRSISVYTLKKQEQRWNRNMPILLSLHDLSASTLFIISPHCLSGCHASIVSWMPCWMKKGVTSAKGSRFSGLPFPVVPYFSSFCKYSGQPLSR